MRIRDKLRSIDNAAIEAWNNTTNAAPKPPIALKPNTPIKSDPLKRKPSATPPDSRQKKVQVLSNESAEELNENLENSIFETNEHPEYKENPS